MFFECHKNKIIKRQLPDLRSYGWDVLMYTQMTLEEQRRTVNPFCRAFPTDVSCTVPNVGAAGGEQNHNGLCILSQNIINEKMYLVTML